VYTTVIFFIVVLPGGLLSLLGSFQPDGSASQGQHNLSFLSILGFVLFAGGIVLLHLN
jgi:hypothetical protein